jgi:parvulin-like peptidyl-prolyl isomerase
MRFKITFTAFVIILFPVFASAVVLDQIAAIVNDQVVTLSEVHAAEKLGLNVSGLPKVATALEDRINHHLIIQQIERQPPPPVTGEMVQEVVDSFTRQHGGPEEFLLFLNSIGMNYEDFDREVHEQLSIREFINVRFRPFVNVKIEDAEAYYNEVLKPELENKGETVPSFEESFELIQSRLAESRVKERTIEWLDQLKKEASIYVKV